MSPSIDEIKEVLSIFLDSELQDLRLEIGNVRLAVAKSGAAGLTAQPFTSPPPRPLPAEAPAAPAPAQAPVEAPVVAAPAARAPASIPEGWVAVTAPSVGTFYRRPSPDQPPFVQPGSKVEANDPLCLIEVMKMFTGVAAPCAGRIAEIVVEDATVIEYGQALMYIEPA